jgi:CRP-like cAMP-binding protein
MKKHIYKYNYPFKTFLRDIFNRIPEMRFLNENKHVFNHILYKLERRNLDANQTLISVNDDIDSVFIVQRGMLEAYTTFEGNEFVLERLPKGACINM